MEKIRKLLGMRASYPKKFELLAIIIFVKKTTVLTENNSNEKL